MTLRPSAPFGPSVRPDPPVAIMALELAVPILDSELGTLSLFLSTGGSLGLSLRVV